MHSSKIWLAGIALAFPLTASVGGGCGGGSGGIGAGGSMATTTSSMSTTTSSTTSSSSTSSTGTGGTGGGTSCACTKPSDCPATGTACAVPSCTSCACTTVSSAAGTACTDNGGTKCDGAGKCVQCTTSADCKSATAPLCSAGKCVAPTCVDNVKDGVETDVDCGGGGAMNCPACVNGKKCLVGSDCVSTVCDATTKLCVQPPTNDTCQGAEMHTLHPGDPTLTIHSTTTDSTKAYTSSCGDTSTPPASPSVVYGLTLTGEGTFNVIVTADAGSTLLPVIDIRQDCTKPSEYCNSYGTGSVNIDQDMTAGTYYVIVTGSPNTSGAFTLTAKLTTAACGDGVINPGELCDPGPAVANDGCGAPGAANQCQLVAAPAGEDKCPPSGSALTSVPAGTTMLTEAMGMSTYGFKDDYVGSCAVTTGGVDRVFQLTPAKSGTMTVKVGYQADGVTPTCSNLYAPDCWGLVLYARTTCATAASQIVCATGPASNPFVPTTLSFAVTANTPYFIFVDGYDSSVYSYGPFNLFITLQ